MSELDRLLAQAREAEPEPLDEDAVERAVTHAALTGRARHRAWVRRRALGALALGSAVAVAAVLLHLAPAPDAAPPSASRPAPSVAPEAVVERERTDLELPTGDRLLAEEGARFHVELATERERRIRLSSGSMLFDVRPLEGGRFTVRTPSAEIVVLGTVFTVTTDPRGTVVRVYEGRVEVRHEGAVEEVVAGDHARVDSERGAEADAASRDPLAPDPLARDARRAARHRRPPTAAPRVEPARPMPRARPAPPPTPSAAEVRAWIAEGHARRALDEARRHVDAGELDPWLLFEADALRALGRSDEAADAYARAAERLPSPRAEQAGFASARLREAPELALRALDAGRVTHAGSPLRERGLALRADLLGRLGRHAERRDVARAYLASYPDGSRAEAMRSIVGSAGDSVDP